VANGALDDVQASARTAVSGASHVRGVTTQRRDGDKHELRVLGGREELADLERRRRCLAVGKGKRRPIRQQTPCANERDEAVAKRFGVERPRDQSIRLEEQLLDREADRVLEIALLELKVV